MDYRNAAIKWSVSAVIHCLLLAVLWSLQIHPKIEPTRVQVTSEITTPDDPNKFTELAPELNDVASLDTPVSLTSRGGSGDGGIGENIADQNNPNATVEGNIAVSAVMNEPARPIQQLAAGRGAITDNVQNLVGTVAGYGSSLGKGTGIGTGVGSGTGTDDGSVDRITVEILRQLDKGKVLVAWLFDASGSLQSRREQIIQRFERVYHELKVLEKDKNTALLTGVVAFGQKVIFMTGNPTADPQAFKNAVRAIKTDDSGIENVNTAVKETCLRWRKYQTQVDRRTLMIVILTDETGDDPSLLDDTVKLVKRNKVPVYVLGPIAPFGRKEINIRWVDKPTGEVFNIPVDRGPETLQSEHLHLPFWGGGEQYDLFPSGFGPYALSRLARESGGIYFMYDDGLIPGPKFDVYSMLEYAPDYMSIKDYQRVMSKSPLRQAILKAAEDSKGSLGTPPMTFADANLNPAMTQGQTIVAQTLLFVNRALANLRTVEKYRDKETSKRWQAQFDLMMGRLLAVKVRCDEYNWHLAQMKVTPKAHSKGMNAWRLVGDDAISYGKKDGPSVAVDKNKPQTNVKKVDPKDAQRAKQDAEAALTYLRRVMKDDMGTPWAVMAERELQIKLGFKWQEFSVPPPPPPGTPAAAAAAEAAQQMANRRTEAMKRVPKF